MTSSSMIFHALYVSSATTRLDDAAIAKLLEQSRTLNRMSGITGMLVHFDGNYIQAVEGPRAAVESLLERVERDPRHKDFKLMFSYESELREFGEWSMGLESVPAPLRDLDALVGLSGGGGALDRVAAGAGPIRNVVASLIAANRL